MRTRTNPASLSAEEREERRAAFAGPTMTRQELATSDGSSYYAGTTNGVPYGIGFKGKALRPAFYYRFRSEDERAKHVSKWLEGLQAQAAAKKERRGPHSLEVGAILYSSWGYGQNNVEFYEVVGVRGAVVDVQELAQDSTPTGDMTGRSVPCPGQYIGAVIKGKRPSSDNRVRFSSFQGASPWDGTPKSWSSYH